MGGGHRPPILLQPIVQRPAPPQSWRLENIGVCRGLMVTDQSMLHHLRVGNRRIKPRNLHLSQIGSNAGGTPPFELEFKLECRGYPPHSSLKSVNSVRVQGVPPPFEMSQMRVSMGGYPPHSSRNHVRMGGGPPASCVRWPVRAPGLYLSSDAFP